MDIMKQITNMAKRSETATSLIELRDSIILALSKEISECKSQFAHLKELDSPFSSSDKLPIKSLGNFLSSASLLSPQELLGNTSALLVFTETEKSFCENLNMLECRLEPMQVSVDLLKHKVSDLSESKTCFDGEIAKIKNDAFTLQNEWATLFADFAFLKNNTFGIRIVSVCTYLTTQVSELIDQVAKEARIKEVITEDFGPEFKTCSTAINLIRKISSAGVSGVEKCVVRYNSEISPKWMYLNDLLQKKRPLISPFNSAFKPSLLNTPKENSGLLRSMKMAKSSTSSAESTRQRSSYSSRRQSIGLGLNLHLGIEPSPSVPFSVSKSDGIIDLGNCLPKSSFQLDILRSVDDNQSVPGNYDDQFSLPNTPAMFSLRSPAVIEESNTTQTTPFQRRDSVDLTCMSKDTSAPSLTSEDRITLLRTLRKHDSKSSRIPTMIPDYLSLRLPVLRKNYQAIHGPSRIPTISPDNVVFCSPERRPKSELPVPSTPHSCGLPVVPSLTGTTPRYGGLQSPPAFLLAHKGNVRHRRVSSSIRSPGALYDVTNSLSRAPSLNAPARKVSLKGLKTPNLSYTKAAPSEAVSPVSWNSTSPERPRSSMGSRFDEIHLTQPLKSVKRPWK
ncbi:hypothetical protein JCM33374_g3612 [Metschnikowia sp. JCM 33374]|nr:hypothetical protein JCM33374_g3612 [Metschnikowia sp. JCM 33374]